LLAGETELFLRGEALGVSQGRTTLDSRQWAPSAGPGYQTVR
jgi:hypothetical protein